MKKFFRTVAVFSLIGLAATSCTKENTVDTQAVMSENAVHYSAGGYCGSEIIATDDAWDVFLDRMFALAKEGYEVTIFGNSSSEVGLSKEVVTYTTTSENDAKTWTKGMIEQGYSVTISYDDRTGIYTCTASR